MPARIIKLLLPLLIFGGLFSYLFVLNPNSVTVTYAAGKTWQAPMAIVLTVVFCFGATVAAAIAFILTLRHSFHDWRRERHFERINNHHQMLAEGREYLALGRYPQARELFKKILNYSPDDIVARIMLACTWKKEGQLEEALKTLEDTKQTQVKNKEMLCLASEINESLGNYTAARDYMALVYKQDQKNILALQKLVALSKELNHFEDAINYQQELIKIAPSNLQSSLQSGLATIELEQAKKLLLEANQPEEFKSALEEILKRHKNYPAALLELAMIEENNKNLKAASKLLMKAFSTNPDILYIKHIARMWLEANNPSTAISMVRDAVNQSKSSNTESWLYATLFLVDIYFHLEMIEQAKEELGKIDVSEIISPDGKLYLKVLKAKLLLRENKPEEAFTNLLQILATDPRLPASLTSKSNLNGHDNLNFSFKRKDILNEPSPQFSTP
jgi:tetratricopeptide (TPR) repeat protein